MLHYTLLKLLPLLPLKNKAICGDHRQVLYIKFKDFEKNVNHLQYNKIDSRWRCSFNYFVD